MALACGVFALRTGDVPYKAHRDATIPAEACKPATPVVNGFLRPDVTRQDNIESRLQSPGTTAA